LVLTCNLDTHVVCSLCSFECLQDVDGRGAIPAVRHSWVVSSGTSCQVRGLAAGVTYRLNALTLKRSRRFTTLWE